jgi:hypothetical protein
MPATKVNLSQMVDLAVGTPEVGALNCNVLHTLLHAMLSRVQTNEKGIAKVCKKYTDCKTINSNNYAKVEVNWPRGSQFTARHTKNRLQFDDSCW